MYVDLHIHSCFSDGTMTVREILEEARDKNVSLLAIADHDCLDAIPSLLKMAGDYDIQAIPAVEITAMHKGRDFHVLGYNFDPQNQALRCAVQKNRATLDGMSDILISRMEKDYPEISLSDFAAFHYEKTLGGWKALHYLTQKGICQTIKEAMGFYGKYNVNYEDGPFLSLKEICAGIRGAGGISVLAHPGQYKNFPFDGDWSKSFEEMVQEGLQGIECHYALHASDVTAACLQFCRQHDLYISAGCDCHGSFAGSAGRPIGFNKIEKHMLKLPF